MWLIELLKYLGETILLDRISPVFFMYQYQRGVLVRAGVYVGNLKPGWNFKRPVTDRFIVCNAALETMFASNINITTSDGKSCTVSSCFEYTVIDEYKFLILANDATSNIRDISMGCIADNLIDLNWADINRRKTINDIKRTLNKDLDQYGINVLRFWFTDLTTTRVFTLVNQ